MQIPICIGVCLKISNDACFRNMLLDSLSFLCKLLCNGAAMGKMPAAAVTKDTAAGSDSSVNIRASAANVQYCFLYWSAKCLLIIYLQTEETGREKERRPAGFSSIYRNVQEQKFVLQVYACIRCKTKL